MWSTLLPVEIIFCRIYKLLEGFPRNDGFLAVALVLLNLVYPTSLRMFVQPAVLSSPTLIRPFPTWQQLFDPACRGRAYTDGLCLSI
jgi:hypothetical protein